MIDFLSFVLALGVGFGVSCWIFGTLLDKSSNIGDYKGDRGDYNAYANFNTKRDKMDKGEIQSFIYLYSERMSKKPSSDPSAVLYKGTDLVRRLTPEERKQIKKSASAGESVSEKNGISKKNSFVDEFEQWEKDYGTKSDLKGVFRPLEEEDPRRTGL